MEGAIKNKSSERIVVGVLINNPDWVVEINGLSTKHFFDKTHKTIYYIINLLIMENTQTIDSLSILARAERIKEASNIINSSGGYEYLESIKGLTKGYTLQDLKGHTDIVLSCSYKREQLEQKEEFIRLLRENPEWKIVHVNQWLQEKQFTLQSEYSLGGEVKLIGDVFDNTWKCIESMRTANGFIGLPSKIQLINEYFTYRKGELVVLGARAKYGKSNWAINEAHNLAVNMGIPVAYFDTEMKTETFLTRIIAVDSGVAVKRIESGAFINDLEEKTAVEMAMERVKKAPIVHRYSHDWTKAKVRETALLLQARYGIQFLIYDYIKVKNVGKGVKEHSELGNWTILLKDLAGELDIPILTFGQLSPYEIRLADSDKINRYASTIAYLLPKTEKAIARDGGAEGGRDYLYIEYNRNGSYMEDEAIGINLYYTRHNVTFEQADYQILTDPFQ